MATADSDKTSESWEDEARREMRRWHEEHPNATLAEMEDAVEEQLNRLRRRLLEDRPPELEARAADRRCARCEGRCVVRGEHQRTVLLPGGEHLRLRRPYMVCQGCGQGRFPLDDALGLFPGGLSPRLHEALARLSTSLPFAQAAREVSWLLGVSVSEQLASRVTERAGATSVALHDREVERLEQERPTPPPGPAVQQISADGAMVPLVHGDWAEVKTVAIGTVGLAASKEGAIAHARGTSRISHAWLTMRRSVAQRGLSCIAEALRPPAWWWPSRMEASGCRNSSTSIAPMPCASWTFRTRSSICPWRPTRPTASGRRRPAAGWRNTSRRCGRATRCRF